MIRRSGTVSVFRKTLRFFILCLHLGLSRCSPSSDTQPEDIASNELPPIADNPKLIIFMIDGFRWDYYEKHKQDMDGFEEFLSEGVQAQWLEPVFPSLSFPAWTTLSTGVYPETHGVLGNYMYNKNTELIFKLEDNMSTARPEWWQASEPIWTLATRKGLKVFIRLWSRCDVAFNGILPNGECTPYRSVTGIDAIEHTLGIAAQQIVENDLVMVYGEHIDNIGHAFGPDSPEMAEALKKLDRVFKGFWDTLVDTALEDKVNIIVVGDHGMTPISNCTFVELGDYVDPNFVHVVLGNGGMVSIDAYANREDEVYMKLKDLMPGVDVYKRAEIPDRFRYKNNILVLTLLVVARPGYFIIGLRPNRPPQYPQDGIYSKQIPTASYEKPSGGAHGYADMPDMRTIFFAKGPAFKKGIVHPPINMVDIYGICASILNIPPEPNNGTWSNVVGMFINKGDSLSYSTLILTVYFLVQFTVFLYA